MRVRRQYLPYFAGGIWLTIGLGLMIRGFLWWQENFSLSLSFFLENPGKGRPQDPFPHSKASGKSLYVRLSAGQKLRPHANYDLPGSSTATFPPPSGLPGNPVSPYGTLFVFGRPKLN